MTGTAVGVAPEAGTAEIPVVRTGADPVAEFTEFVRAKTSALYRIAYMLCGDEHRAKDLVQIAFERTFKAWKKVGDGDPFAYARRVLATARIDTWRRTRREVLTGDPASGVRSPSVLVFEGEVVDRDRIVRALMQLTVKQRRVVVLRFMLDRSVAETAAELGLSEGTVKSTAAHGLRRLRTVVVPNGGERS